MKNKVEFQKTGYVVLRQVFHKQTIELLSTQFKMMRDADKFICEYNNQQFESECHDSQVVNSYAKYAAGCFESAMLNILPIVEKTVGKELYPTYSYARIMELGAFMEKHKDRPSCQFSVTLCVEEDKEVPYPIFMENYNGEASSIILNTGDAIVYHGTQLNHWREEFAGTQHIQAFFHYVDKNGPYKHYKFDERPMLGIIKQ